MKRSGLMTLAMGILFACASWTAAFAAETNVIVNGDFAQGVENWELTRCAFAPETQTIVFSPDIVDYAELQQRFQLERPAESEIRVAAELSVTDPKNMLATKKGYPQVLLSFLDVDGQNLAAPGEAGLASGLIDTGGEKKTFSVTYKIPTGAVAAVVRVKTGIPLAIQVHALQVLVEEIDEETAGFPFVLRNLHPDSVANYAFLNHRPAGSRGYLRIDGDEFIFENGEKIRWFGLNLVASRAFEHTTHLEADVFAATLAGLGVNMVRLHHLTPVWQDAIPFYQDRTKSTLEINDAALEKLDYLVYALQREGIYITNEMIDSSLMPAPGEIPYDLASGHSLKLLMLIDPEVQSYIQRWITNFYGRKNRYTGLSWIEDPQLAVLGIVNEVSIAYHNGGLLKHLPEKAWPLVEARYQAYRTAQGWPEKSFDLELFDPEAARFWDALLKESFAAWAAFLRELGYRGLISGSNFGENFFHYGSSTGMDFMDAHLYWGYASYMDGVDAKTRILSGDRWNDLVKPPKNENNYTKELFARFSLSSTPNHPLISSEHRSSITNFQRSAYRAAGLPFFAALHAFQEWDGFYIFASQGKNNERMGHRLDVRYDTTYLATFPLASYLLRGKVIRPAERSILLEVDDKEVFTNPRGVGFYYDGLFQFPERHKLRLRYPGMTVNTKHFDEIKPLAAVKQMTLPEPLPPLIESDTGELRRNWEEGWFSIDTTKVQGVEGYFDCTTDFDFTDLSLSTASPFGVFFVAAGQEKDITSASRLLFVAVNTTVNSGDINQLTKGWSLPGTAPVLVVPVAGILTLKSGIFDCWNLDENGLRNKCIATATKSFTFDTGRDQTVWYELIRTNE